MLTKCLTAFALLASAAALPASADELGLSPGLWQYSLKSSLLGQPINESGKECISKQEAQTTLAQAATKLNNGCTITSENAISNGVSFTMQCTGSMPGIASGEITRSGNTLNMSLSGLLGAEGAQMPIQATASATRVNTSC